MKKNRFLTLFVAILTALTLTVSFVGCGGGNKSSCKHNWAAATCTAPAHCTLCNATKGKAAGHKYGDPIVTAATCDGAGSSEKECSVCHDKTYEVLAKLSHNYVPAVTGEANCENDQITTYTCSLCNDAYSEVTARHVGHKLDSVTWTESSAVNEGGSDCSFLVTETAKCGTCQKDIERTYHRHIFTLRIVSKTLANCKDKGTITYGCACEDPQYEYTEELPLNPAAHDWQASTKTGVTHECSICHATKAEVAIEGNSATIEAGALAGKSNVAIKTNSGITLAPDAALTGKMAGGVQVAAEQADPADLPEITGDDAEKLQGATIYNFELKDASSDNKIDFGGSKMTVSVPYEVDEQENIDPASVYACYIKDDGTLEYIDAVYGADMVTFDAAHFSHYTVVRLTPAERCAKLGHNYTSNAIPATCTEDGYTVKSCKRCGDFKREAGAKMTGHDYGSSVVAPTCTDKGYTVMTCKHTGCDDSYITKYTAPVPHAYTDKKVAATCTAKGYTEHTCDNCGSSYRDAYVDMVAHKYSKGVCTVCGKRGDASAADNFYINLVNSLGKSDSYYADLSGLKFDIVSQMGSNSETVNCQIDAYKLLIGFDDDGYLVGSGEGKAKITMAENNGAPQVQEQKIALAFRNKKIYVRMNDDYSVTSQDSLKLGDIKQYMDAFYGDAAKKIKDTLFDGNAKNSPLNAGMAKVMDYLFDKKASTGGYTLTLNYEHVAEVLEYVNTHCAADVFDALVGEGKFDKLVKFAQDLPEMTLNEFILEAVDYLNGFNLKIGDIYNLIDAVFKAIDPKSTVNALEYVAKNGSKKMGAVVEELSGGKMTEAALKAQIDGFVEQYVPMLKSKDVPLLQMAGAMVPIGGEGFSFADYIKSSLDALVEAAENAVGVVIATDDSGAFQSLSVKVKDLDYSQTIPAELIGAIGGGSQDRPMDLDYVEDAKPMAEDSSSERTNIVSSVKGDLTLLLTNRSGAVNNNADVVKAIDAARASFVAAIKSNVGKAIDNGEYSDKYTILTKGDLYVVVPYVDIATANRYGTYGLIETNVSYKGEQCNVYRGYSFSGEILDLDGNYSYSKSCTGWTYNSLSSAYVYGLYYKIYKKGNTVLGVEFDWDRLKELASEEEDFYDSYPMYLNASQGKLSVSQPHKYVKVKDGGVPTKCEEVVCDVYRCTVCGSIDYRYRSRWHEFVWSYELKDKTKGCEGGVVEVLTCKYDNCNKTERKEYSGVDGNGNHRMFEIMYPIDTGSECTETYVSVYGCVCGRRVENIHISGGDNGCRFDETSNDYCNIDKDGLCTHGYAYHRTSTYQCYLSQCGYTYTEEHCRTAPNSQCKVTESWVYTLKNGTKYTQTRESTSHAASSGEPTDENGLKVYNFVCNRCKQTVSVRKEDQYGREVYYYSNEDKHGYERVYDEYCNYVEYSLDENGNRYDRPNYGGVNHIWERKSLEAKHSCTQPHAEVMACAACKSQETFDYFYGHDFVGSDKEGYHCFDCGMTNDVSVSGPVLLENLSKNSGNLIVGYYVREWNSEYVNLDVEFYIDYNYGDGTYVEVSYEDNKNNTEQLSGKIIVSRKEISQLLNQYSEGEMQTFTAVFIVRMNKGDKEWIGDKNTYEYAITFTRAELQQILAA